MFCMCVGGEGGDNYSIAFTWGLILGTLESHGFLFSRFCLLCYGLIDPIASLEISMMGPCLSAKAILDLQSMCASMSERLGMMKCPFAHVFSLLGCTT